MLRKPLSGLQKRHNTAGTVGEKQGKKHAFFKKNKKRA
jgi:hypothetical protein